MVHCGYPARVKRAPARRSEEYGVEAEAIATRKPAMQRGDPLSRTKPLSQCKDRRLPVTIYGHQSAGRLEKWESKRNWPNASCERLHGGLHIVQAGRSVHPDMPRGS